MALIKIKSESMDLADTYAFTGTVTGAGGGKILQVVSTSTNAMTSHVRNDDMTNFLTTITPASTSSKILVLVSVGLNGSNDTSDNGITVMRKIGTGSYEGIQTGTGGSNTNATFIPFMNTGGGSGFGMSFQLVDSPNTTSLVSYQLRCKVNSGRTMYINRRNGTDYGSSSGMTLLEIAG